MPSTNNLYAGMLSKLGQIAVPAVLVTGILICLGFGSSDDGEAVENKKPVVQDLSIQTPEDSGSESE